jgi:hypothetical protein
MNGRRNPHLKRQPACDPQAFVAIDEATQAVFEDATE